MKFGEIMQTAGDNRFIKIIGFTGNDMETSGLLYSAMSALIIRTLFPFTKVVFFSLITKVIPLKNG